MSTRVLMLSADNGGEAPATRALSESLRDHPEVASVESCTDLSVIGPRFGRLLSGGFDIHLGRLGWSNELTYRVFHEYEFVREAGQLALALIGGRALRRTVASRRVDVVVSAHPLLSAALGELRARGWLYVPVCSVVEEVSGLQYWAHPSIDRHLLVWPESIAEVERIAGRGKATVVRPMVDQSYLAPLDPAESRAWLRLPRERPVVVVSGGAWGTGDLEGATESARESVQDMLVIALTGHNGAAHAVLSKRFFGDRRVRVLGFTDQMPALLGAANALIYTTDGTTALEAHVVGCPLINYGAGVARARVHAQAMLDLGIGDWAPHRSDLGPMLRRMLADGRRPPLDVGVLPAAADVIVEVAKR
jgi:processive 1,2-diacylglycerol beta-glucosyltransferase